MSRLIKNIGVLGASIKMGQQRLGVDLGPRTLRENGLLSRLRAHDSLVHDFGDVKEVGDSTLGQTFHRLYKQTKEMVQNSNYHVILGGDHSISLATVSALMDVYPDLCVIWVDAHGDMNTPETSPSGNLHGMPLAALMGEFAPAQIEGMEWVIPRLKPEKLALVGVRDLDDGEKELIRRRGIKAVSAEEVQRLGMKAVMQDVLQSIDPNGHSPLHMSFDIDGMDPNVAPATGIRVPEGLQPSEVIELAGTLARTGRLVSSEFVEVNPAMVENYEELARTLNVVFDVADEIMKNSQSVTFPQSQNTQERATMSLS